MKRLVVIVSLVIFAAFATAQENRSTLTGHVSDSSGASVVHARVHVTEMDTGAAINVYTTNSGYYTVPFLNPGRYQISISQAGFKNYLHSGLILQTGETVKENITLAVGDVHQTVVVSGGTPLIDTANADTGEILSSEQIQDLPSNGRAPLGFAHLEYGAVAKGKHSMSQTTPFANTTADDFSLGGGASSSNELLLNGVPNMEDSQRTAGFSPLLDAVNAVRVDEFTANAALGDTSGGTVNITTKAGTNDFHGSLLEYYAGSRPLTAEPYFTPIGTKVQSTHFNQYGATIGGPIRIPHLFDGRNRLFFFYAFEGYDGSQPGTYITSVPTAAERTGDFSALLAYDSNDQLYNPYSGKMVGSTVYRQPIQGNSFANAGLSISPVAKAYLAQVPLPNFSGPSTAPDGENNFFAPDPTADNYKSNQARVDYTISDANKIFFETHRSNYKRTSGDIFHNPFAGSYAQTVIWGGQVDDVENFSPSLSLETRLGFSRYTSTAEPNGLGISPTTVGFPSYISSNSGQPALPSMNFSDSADIPSLGGDPGNTENTDDIQLFASIDKTWGRHTIKIGPDIRANKESSYKAGSANGSYDFNSSSGDFVTASSVANPQDFGGALALFELGLPSDGSYDVNTKFQYDNWYFGFFAQDDWKVMPNLTLSMGVRFEHETPVVESNNQMVVGWDPTTINAATQPAEAAYAASPNAMLPVSSFSPTGGILYASSSHRSPYNTAPLYVSPRFGFSFAPNALHNTLVIRGGFGIYDNPFNDYNFGQSYGYSQTTNFISSTNNGVSPITTLSDPFPETGNPIQRPLGSSLGINTNLGNKISFYAPVKVQYSEKWSLDIQKQFRRTWLVEIGYLGVHQVHNSYKNDLSAVPLLPFLSRSPKYDSAVTKKLSASTANPFYKNIPGPSTSLNSSKKISVASLLHAYPEYSDVSESLIPGASANFNAAMLKISKRLADGLQFEFNYEHSRQLGYSAQLNPGGPLWYGETTSDFPDHASLMAIYMLPFGSGRRFMNNSRALDEIFGGYTLSTIYQYLSGTPLQWGNVDYTGNYSDFHNDPHKTSGPSFNTADFDRVGGDQPNSYNYRTFPEYLLRSDPTKNFDFSILKNFTIGEHVIVQPRVDAFNAFNHPQFNSANLSPKSSSFGDINKQLNTNRQLQGGIHVIF